MDMTEAYISQLNSTCNQIFKGEEGKWGGEGMKRKEVRENLKINQ
jgi:hypothetical protein